LILKMLMSGERFVEQSNTSINQNVSSSSDLSR